MSFEDFEELLCRIGEVESCVGAAAYGVDDYEVKLIRSYGNPGRCEISRLYEAIKRKMLLVIESEKIKAEKELLGKMLDEGYSKAKISKGEYDERYKNRKARK